MKKLFVAFVAVFMLGASTLSANEIAKADSEYIFSTSKASSQVVAMDDTQMVVTEGEGPISANAFYLGYLAALAYNPALIGSYGSMLTIYYSLLYNPFIY